MQRNSASLLGLPVELRLNIYDYVFQQNLDIRPFDGFDIQRHYPPHPTGLSGSYVKAHEVRTQPACFSIPWLNLMLSCDTLSQEIQEYMESSSYLDIDANRTFEMDLKPQTQGEAVSLVKIAWRRIPCPPQKVRRLIVHNDGAARTITPALNLFFHYGMSMDRNRPLPEHINLDELVVNVLSPRTLVVPEQTPGLEPVDEQARSKPEFEFAYTVLSQHHRCGRLAGYSKKVRVCGDGQYKEFDVVIPVEAGRSNQWAR